MNIERIKRKMGNGLISLLAAGTLYLGNPDISYCQTNNLRVKEEVTFDKENPDYYAIGTLGDQSSKIGFKNESLSGNSVFGIRNKLRFKESNLEATILGDTKNSFKLRTEAGFRDFNLGFAYGEGNSNRITNLYGRFQKNSNVLGVGISQSEKVRELNYFATLDFKNIPLLGEFLLSGGTSGLESENNFLAFRVPSLEDKDFGYEGFAIFDDELKFYKFRFAIGNARMGSVGHYINTAGTGPRVANIDGINSIVNETDLFYPIALEIWERGEYGIEISGKDKPNIEIAWNPNRYGNWIGMAYDFGRGKFSLEGGSNIKGVMSKVASDLNDRYSIRLEKTFNF